MTKPIHIHEALKAQQALRAAANLPREDFPIEAFVGMISDEVEALRNLGHTDEQIATLIQTHSSIEITARQIAENYAHPDQRNSPHAESQ